MSTPSLPPYRPGLSVTVGIEQRRERFWYHFDNDSAFDTATLVPHFFEQHYSSAKTWFIASVTYPLGDIDASTEFSFSPEVTTFGSDIDTFFQPSGDVVTSGSRGNVFLRSMSITERLGLATWRGWTTGVTLVYRRSRATFPPDDRIITHTQPPSETREFTTARETTTSRNIESGVHAHARFRVRGNWHLTIRSDLLPLARAKLIVSLPDKYPGQDIVAEARAFSAELRTTVERRTTRTRAGVGVDLCGAKGYDRAASFGRRGVSVFLFFGVGG